LGKFFELIKSNGFTATPELANIIEITTRAVEKKLARLKNEKNNLMRDQPKEGIGN
jgi:predicted HTH transcriptional regulator